jgi:hypothetical protein
MAFEPVHLKRWTMPDSYFGEVWPDYYSAGVGQSRDSDTLERSNFASMLQELGFESETVLVVRENHWAVGWVEWIAIHATDEVALRKADRIVDGLNSYPVVNESHWSELEMEEANEVWRDCYTDRERVAYMRANPSQFEFYNFKDMMRCARGRYFAGYASELLN